MTLYMADTNNPPVKGYQLDAPNKELALSSLKRFLDEEKANELWELHCKLRGAPANTNDIDELSRIFKSMANETGAVGVVGKSLTVRVISYKILSKTSKK